VPAMRCRMCCFTWRMCDTPALPGVPCRRQRDCAMSPVQGGLDAARPPGGGAGPAAPGGPAGGLPGECRWLFEPCAPCRRSSQRCRFRADAGGGSPTLQRFQRGMLLLPDAANGVSPTIWKKLTPICLREDIANAWCSCRHVAEMSAYLSSSSSSSTDSG
jgi:hypothetical protein